MYSIYLNRKPDIRADIFRLNFIYRRFFKILINFIIRYSNVHITFNFMTANGNWTESLSLKCLHYLDYEKRLFYTNQEGTTSSILIHGCAQPVFYFLKTVFFIIVVQR